MTHIYVECNCDTDGSSSHVCDSTSGKCSCKSELIVGDKCDKCKPGYFGFPDCKGKYNNKLALDSRISCIFQLVIATFKGQLMPVASMRMDNVIVNQTLWASNAMKQQMSSMIFHLSKVLKIVFATS